MGHKPELLRCRRCGWVHMALSQADILPGADLAALRRCFHCHAPIIALDPCTEADAPRGVTLQGVLVLSSDVAARLIAERDAAHDELRTLLRERGDGEFTEVAARQHVRLIRRIAIIDAARHGRNFSALTCDEIAWLQAQGVPTG